jgi:hypothetical protein
MAIRAGIPAIKNLDISYTNLTEGVDFNFHQVPNGIYWARIPRHDPINMPGSFLLNIARFKTHGMGVTLCCKNLQGATSRSVQNFCSNNNSATSNTQPSPSTAVSANYNTHVANHVPHWDIVASMGGAYYESWVTRTVDNLQSITTPQLHVIEGITGRDGDGGNSSYWGPNPVDAPWSMTGSTGKIYYTADGITYYGTSASFLTNVIIFGMNAFKVDAIGHYLAGHEPGRFGMFHIAKERGVTDHFNPANIPVYEWDSSGNATLKQLADLTRTPLLTYYLWRPDPSTTYTATYEPYWRMLDTWDYENNSIPTNDPVYVREISSRPDVIILNQNRPNPFNPTTSIEFSIPKSGYVRLEVYNTWGQRVDVIADRYYNAGSHMVNWNAAGKSSGTYFYRLRFGGTDTVKKMILVK